MSDDDGLPRLRLEMRSGQAITNCFDTAVIWKHRLVDTHGMWSIDEPARIWIPIHGVWSIAVGAAWPNHYGPHRLIVEALLGPDLFWSPLGEMYTDSAFRQMILPQGASLRTMLWQSSGALLVVPTAEFQAVYLG